MTFVEFKWIIQFNSQLKHLESGNPVNH